MRPPDAVRLALGLAVLARPGLPLRLTGSPDGAGVRRTVRVLGGRYAVQGAAGLLTRAPWLPAADATVDGLHAVSMVGLAVVSPGHRRLALASAVLATALATADLTGGRAT
jgi:hypothetical protein